MIGSFGEVVYVATYETLRTFKDFNRKSAGRWAKHEVLGRKPVTQWLGPGLDTISFTMMFDVAYGINPRQEMEALLEIERTGTAQDLTIGGKSLGAGLWIITSLEQTWNVIDNQGNLLQGTVTISLEEYVG